MAILRRTSSVTCILACSLAVQACDLIREPLAVTLTEERAMVTSVLSAGDTIARVLLTIVPPMSDPFNPFGEPHWVPIADAHVRLVTGNDTIALMAQPGAAANACIAGPVHEQTPAGALLPGCYVGTVPGGIRTGETYGLIADLPGRGRIEGRTTVPAPPVVLQPSTGADLVVWTSGPAPEPAVVEWSGTSVGSHIQIGVRSTDQSCPVYLTTGTGFGQAAWLTVADTSSAEIHVRMGCEMTHTEVAGDLLLTGFDTAYSRYYRMTQKNHGLSDASAGFTGPAIGVLGSAATARHPVQFVRD